MNKIKNLVSAFLIIITLYSCLKEGPAELPRRPLQPIGFVYTFNFGGVTGPAAIPTKKLKIKVLDGQSNVPIKNAVHYVKAVGTKANCSGFPCDSLLYEDSVVTDALGEAIIIRRGNEEALRDVKGFWSLSHLKQTYSFADYDSTVFKLWPEVWVKIQVKTINRYGSSYLFSPRLECISLGVVYQPLLPVNTDTSFIQRLWANQNYKVTLNLYKDQLGTLNGAPAAVLKEFNHFIGNDTTELVLNY